MKATAKQSVYDHELGFVRVGEVVELSAAQQKRVGDLFEVEKAKRTTKKPATIPPTETKN